MAMGLLDILKLKGLQLGRTPNLNFNPRADTYDPNNIENVKDALLADAQRRGLPTNAMDNSAAPQNAPMPVSAALPNSMGATAPQPPPVAPSGNGLMSWLNSDSGKGMLYGAGAGLIAKMQNKNDPVVPTALAAAEQYKQKAALQSLGQQLASANLTPQQKAFVQYAVQSGDPKLMNVAAKMMFPTTNASANNPYTLSAGQVRYGADGKPIVDRSHDIKTQLQLNAEAAGYKPGTKEYQDYIKSSGGAAASRYGSALQKLQGSLKNQIAIDTGLEGDDLEKAIESYKEHKTTLPDGRPLPPMSRTASELIDGIAKAASTSTLITKGVQANQADVELNVLSKKANEWLKPYGSTILNYSPDQVMDTFKSDDVSQKKLGRFIAAQQIQYEIAQNEIKLAQGEPGVTSTQELMKLGQQLLDAKYPRLSNTARQESQRAFREALGEGLQARNEYGVGAASATGKHEPEAPKPKMAESDIQYNMRTYHKTRDQVLKAAKEQGYS